MIVHDSGNGHWVILCPGCQTPHVIDSRWSFNGDMERPTFSPSLLCTKGELTEEQRAKGQVSVCHSFVRDGRVEFLADCTHGLAGQTVELPAFAW